MTTGHLRGEIGADSAGRRRTWTSRRSGRGSLGASQRHRRRPHQDFDVFRRRHGRHSIKHFFLRR
jgi:hypothetical protein